MINNEEYNMNLPLQSNHHPQMFHLVAQSQKRPTVPSHKTRVSSTFLMSIDKSLDEYVQPPRNFVSHCPHRAAAKKELFVNIIICDSQYFR